MKRCRYCAEEIQEAAIVCKHCGKDQTVDPAAKSHRAAWLVGIVLVVGLAWLVQLVISEASEAAELVRHQRELREDLGRWHADCDEFDLKTVRQSIDEGFRQTCIERKVALDRREAQVRTLELEPTTLPMRPIVEAWMQ